MLLFIVLVSAIGCAVAAPPMVRTREEIEAFEAFLKNKIDNAVGFQTRMLQNPLAKAWENSGKYQGDILLEAEQVLLLVQQFAEGRNAYIWPDTKWPDNTIVYEFAPEFSREQRAAILNGIEDIERNTCIRFRRRESRDRNYVRVTGRPDGCYANVGYWSTRGIHTYNVAVNTPGSGCFRHTTIVHEWMHIIGFLHMQSTYNRDDYVQVLWQNIWPGLEFNFDKYSSEIVDNLKLPYEYDSNLHYGRYGFSINGLPTLLPLNEDHSLMGQQEYITDIDWLRVNRHYNCIGAWDEIPDSTQDLN